MSSLVTFWLRVLFVLNIHNSIQCPLTDPDDMKAAYKSGETAEQATPITLDLIKTKLKQKGIFDQDTVHLDDRERKELKKLFDTVEIMVRDHVSQPPASVNTKPVFVFADVGTSSKEAAQRRTGLRDARRQIPLGKIIRPTEKSPDVPLRPKLEHEGFYNQLKHFFTIRSVDIEELRTRLMEALRLY